MQTYFHNGWINAIVIGMVALGGACLAGLPIEAQSQIGVQGNFADDMDFGIGGRLVFPFPYYQRLRTITSFDYFFPDGGSYFEINGNVMYAFSSGQRSFTPYLGGCLTLAHFPVNVKGSQGSDTEIGPNILGGVQFPATQGWKPYVECRFELSGYDQFVITGGIYLDKKR